MNQQILDILILIIAGCVGGFISGILGVGGGIIFVPILDYFLLKNNVPSNDLVAYTLANSFFAIMVSGIVGSIPAFKSKSINLVNLFTVGFSAILIGLIMTYFINSGDWYSPLSFKLFFCLLLIATAIKTFFQIENDIENHNLGHAGGILVGSITGIVSSLSGLGGGIVMIPLFMMLGNMTIKKASALSLAIIPTLSLPYVIYYGLLKPDFALKYSTGFIVWPIILPIIFGVLMTVKYGVNTAKTMSPRTIKFIFVGFIFITIIRILSSIV